MTPDPRGRAARRRRAEFARKAARASVHLWSELAEALAVSTEPDEG